MSILWKLAIFAGLVAVGISLCGFYNVFNEIHVALNHADVLARSVNKETYRLFKHFDQDDDGYLDIFEFQAATNYLKKNEVAEEQDSDNFVANILIKEKLLNATIPSGEEYLTLTAHFEPLDFNSMTAFIKSKTDGIDRWSDVHIQGLRNWTKAFIEKLNFTTDDLKIFLPKSVKNVGEVWDVVLPLTSKYEPGLSHYRYQQDPPMGDKERVLTNLLTMFAPRPFLLNRFAPQGTIAVLRAVNDDFMDIVFRIHAEFQVNEPPNFPFWFTPAQFAGNIIISHDGKHVEDFTLFVPNDKKLNVDMEWITARRKITDQSGDPWEMEVDIGYLPQMSLSVDGPSRKHGEKIQNKQDIIWNKEITEPRARRILQKKFYPFQEIEYLPFNKTYEKAENEDKLVHQIILWGSLDDQSC